MVSIQYPRSTVTTDVIFKCYLSLTLSDRTKYKWRHSNLSFAGYELKTYLSRSFARLHGEVEGRRLLLRVAAVAPQGLLGREEPEAGVAGLPGLLDGGAVKNVRMPVERIFVGEIVSAKLTDNRLKQVSENVKVDDRTVLNVPRRTNGPDFADATSRKAVTRRRPLVR